MTHDAILKDVTRYYTQKLEEHGTTPRGVDWNSAQSQLLRFDQLLRIVEPTAGADFSLLDYGCGFGAMCPVVRSRHPSCRYAGFDVAPRMVEEARVLYSERDVVFVDALPADAKYDYVVASGIFNVKLEQLESDWKQYVLDIAEKCFALSTRGFAFNVLTSYSDKDFMRPHLYYANPTEIFEFCKQRLSPRVALLHDYPLYEFTVLVRRP
jgi:SAM-dependent methyltransferase